MGDTLTVSNCEIFNDSFLVGLLYFLGSKFFWLRILFKSCIINSFFHFFPNTLSAFFISLNFSKLYLLFPLHPCICLPGNILIGFLTFWQMIEGFRQNSGREAACGFHIKDSWIPCLIILAGLYALGGLPWWLSGKEPSCQCRRPGFNPWVRKVSCRRKWQPTPVFLPGKSHGQRILEGSSPWGRKVGYDWVTNTHTYTHTHTHTHTHSLETWLTSQNPRKKDLAILEPFCSYIFCKYTIYNIQYIEYTICISGRFFTVWATREAPK